MWNFTKTLLAIAEDFQYLNQCSRKNSSCISDLFSSQTQVPALGQPGSDCSSLFPSPQNLSYPNFTQPVLQPPLPGLFCVKYPPLSLLNFCFLQFPLMELVFLQLPHVLQSMGIFQASSLLLQFSSKKWQSYILWTLSNLCWFIFLWIHL